MKSTRQKSLFLLTTNKIKLNKKKKHFKNVTASLFIIEQNKATKRVKYAHNHNHKNVDKKETL